MKKHSRSCSQLSTGGEIQRYPITQDDDPCMLGCLLPLLTALHLLTVLAYEGNYLNLGLTQQTVVGITRTCELGRLRNPRWSGAVIFKPGGYFPLRCYQNCRCEGNLWENHVMLGEKGLITTTITEGWNVNKAHGIWKPKAMACLAPAPTV